MNIYAVGALLAAIALLSGWAFVSSHLRYELKLMLASLLVALSIIAWYGAVNLLGYPVSGLPQDGAVLYSIVIDKPHDAIYLWAQNKVDARPRVYEIKFSDPLARKLLEALIMAQRSGGRMIFHLAGGPSVSGGAITSDGGFAVYVDVVPAMPNKSPSKLR